MRAADYTAKYYAYELTKQCSAHQIEKLSKSIFNATVDLNPHQIDAALFAFRSPLSRGAILADEVGLGKTIEAGFIVSQLWAERRRRILCIVPAALRKQWQGELADKFFIESLILESKNFNRCVKDGISNPFDQRDTVVICSYHFARNKETEVAALPWDLVVIDEAHRLRNVYKKSNKIARTLKDIIGMRPKVLLTATPLQNSLMELYGLVSFVDPHVFGSEDSFRDQFARRSTDMSAADFQSLRARISPVCQRTLRKQVTEYIRYTNRVSLTQDFTPTDDEVKLYEAVSEYLQRPDAFALPSSQRSLMTLVLRKILASSSFAIAATLGRLIERLDAMHKDVNGAPAQEFAEDIMPDYELTEEMQDEWSEDKGNAGTTEPSDELSDKHAQQVMAAAIRDEIKDLAAYKELAESITHNAKGEALRIALKTGFEKLDEFSAPLKALIFTESRRTQRYLYEILENNGYSGQLVMLNGTNTEQPSREVYKRWVQRHEGHQYRLGHPLAQQVIQAARTRQLPCCEVEFLYEAHPGKISVLQQLIGQSGWLRLFHLSIQAFETEEHILPVAIADDGTVIDADVCRRLFSIRSRLGKPFDIEPEINTRLDSIGDQAQTDVCTDIATRNRDYFELEMEKLDHWAEDLKTQLETELKGLDKEIKAAKRDARQAADLEAKVVLHRKVKDLEKERTDKRRRLFDAQDDVDSRKDDLITDVETRLKQQVSRDEMFTIRWRVA